MGEYFPSSCLNLDATWTPMSAELKQRFRDWSGMPGFDGIIFNAYQGASTDGGAACAAYLAMLNTWIAMGLPAPDTGGTGNTGGGNGGGETNPPPTTVPPDVQSSPLTLKNARLAFALWRFFQ